MMNRKETSASQLAVATTSVLWRFCLQENGSVKRTFRFGLSWTVSGVWKQPLSFYEISPYKMAPLCFFHGIIFLFGSSVKPWRSLLAAHFSLCIDSDLQKQHRAVPIKRPRASRTPGGKIFSSGEKKRSAPALLTSQHIRPNRSSSGVIILFGQ